MRSAGSVLISMALQVLNNPMTNSRLSAEHAISPAENRYRDGVPKAPNSLTIRVRWL